MVTHNILTEALSLISQGKHNRARALCKKVLHAQPEHFHAHLIYGVALLKSNECEKAINAFKTAVDCTKAPALLAQAYNNIAACYLQLRQAKNAEKAATTAISLDSTKLDYHLNLIAALDQSQQWQAMRDTCVHTSKVWPNHEETLLNTAIASRHLGNLDIGLTSLLNAFPALSQLSDWLEDPMQSVPANGADSSDRRTTAIGKVVIFEWILTRTLIAKKAASLTVPASKMLMTRLLGLLYTFDTSEQQLATEIADYMAEEGHVPFALTWYQLAYELNPNDSYCEHMVNAGQGRTSDHAPSHYVSDLYDKHAPEFEHRLVTTLGYNAPQLLVKALKKLGLNTAENVLDLGCGTGLLGQALESHIVTQHLVGQDISAAMLKLASQKGCYQGLHQGDILKDWPSKNTRWDLICATDVFIYIGRLTPLFEQAKKSLHPKGYLAFTTERLTKKSNQTHTLPYTLAPSGRYQHDTNAIVELARTFGFNCLVKHSFDLRKERDQQIIGDLFVFQAS